MTLSIADTLKYINLQMAAEALYRYVATEPGAELIPGAVRVDEPLTVENLTTGNGRASKFTATQAADFADKWIVVQHKSNTPTGFSGTLFKNKDSGELVLSFRSTEFADDNARDNKATNELEIAKHGWAFGQIDDMEAWYKTLTVDGVPLSQKSFAVTGYSLGGHLATAFNLLHPGVASQVVTFNGAGVGSINGMGEGPGTPTLASAAGQAALSETMELFHKLRPSTDPTKSTDLTDQFQPCRRVI